MPQKRGQNLCEASARGKIPEWLSNVKILRFYPAGFANLQISKTNGFDENLFTKSVEFHACQKNPRGGGPSSH